jgi:D-glycero-alpha-D-manno-heptose-7-phosphate kinase
LKQVKVQSPTRVDLAGGTLDMWPLFTFVGGARTINIAIDIYTSCTISEHANIEIESPDLKKHWSFSELPDVFAAEDGALELYKKVLVVYAENLGQLKTGFKITTTSQSPIGGGLGGSSSLVISMLKAIRQFLNMPPAEGHDLVYLAHNIEAEMLRTPTGTQDYYPAVTGGMSYLDYRAQAVEQKVFTTEGTPLEDHFLLVYTGRSHHSGLNNFEVLKSAVQGEPRVLEALREIKNIAAEMSADISAKRWERLPELFKREFNARIQLTPAFTSPEIEKLAEICLASGALAVKICGAGGGGCVLVWVPPQKRESVVKACEREKFQCLNAKPVRPLPS